MNLIVILICAYFIHRTASGKGIASFSYIIHYIAIAMLTIFAFAMLAVRVYGPDKFGGNMLVDTEVVNILFAITIINVAFELVLFFYFRNKIQKITIEEDEEIHPTPPEKKDFSYFR